MKLCIDDSFFPGVRGAILAGKPAVLSLPCSSPSKQLFWLAEKEPKNPPKNHPHLTPFSGGPSPTERAGAGCFSQSFHQKPRPQRVSAKLHPRPWSPHRPL